MLKEKTKGQTCHFSLNKQSAMYPLSIVCWTDKKLQQHHTHPWPKRTAQKFSWSCAPSVWHNAPNESWVCCENMWVKDSLKWKSSLVLLRIKVVFRSRYCCHHHSTTVRARAPSLHACGAMITSFAQSWHQETTTCYKSRKYQHSAVEEEELVSVVMESNLYTADCGKPVTKMRNWQYSKAAMWRQWQQQYTCGQFVDPWCHRHRDQILDNSNNQHEMRHESQPQHVSFSTMLVVLFFFIEVAKEQRQKETATRLEFICFSETTKPRVQPWTRK